MNTDNVYVSLITINDLLIFNNQRTFPFNCNIIHDSLAPLQLQLHSVFSITVTKLAVTNSIIPLSLKSQHTDRLF